MAVGQAIGKKVSKNGILTIFFPFFAFFVTFLPFSQSLVIIQQHLIQFWNQLIQPVDLTPKKHTEVEKNIFL